MMKTKCAKGTFRCGSYCCDPNTPGNYVDPTSVLPDWCPNQCTCNKVAKRMECYKCGYPYCEAEMGDDGTPCNCTYCRR